MKGGPSTPTIKKYIKACETAGYKPTAIKMCYSGDVIMFFDNQINTNELKSDAWEIEIEKA